MLGFWSLCLSRVTTHAHLSAPACEADKRCGHSPATRQDLRRTGQQNSRPPDSELLYAGRDNTLCSADLANQQILQRKAEQLLGGDRLSSTD